MKHRNRCVLVSTVDSEIEVLEVMNDVLLRNVFICKSVHRYTRRVWYFYMFSKTYP